MGMNQSPIPEILALSISTKIQTLIALQSAAFAPVHATASPAGEIAVSYPPGMKLKSNPRSVSALPLKNPPTVLHKSGT